MDREGNLPDLNRLSVLTATILLAFALARLINLPTLLVPIQISALSFVIQIDVQTIAALLIAGLTAAGTHWLLLDHPAMKDQSTRQHWLLPSLTAWAISLPLFQLPVGPLWWLGFSLGGLIMTLVLLAEYIVLDPDDIRQPPAAAGLTAIAFSLFLVLAAALRYSESRLFFLLLAITLAVSLVSLRTLHLRLHGYWAFLETVAIAIFIAQIAAALHYWPLAPVSFGLMLLGPAYALTNFVGNLAEDEPVRYALIEPAIVLSLVWAAAIWLG